MASTKKTSPVPKKSPASASAGADAQNELMLAKEEVKTAKKRLKQARKSLKKVKAKVKAASISKSAKKKASGKEKTSK